MDDLCVAAASRETTAALFLTLLLINGTHLLLQGINPLLVAAIPAAGYLIGRVAVRAWIHRRHPSAGLQPATTQRKTWPGNSQAGSGPLIINLSLTLMLGASLIVILL